MDKQFQASLGRVRNALGSMGNGDPEPFIASWNDDPDATLFGAWGPVERGTPALRETFRWVGGRFTGGVMVPDDLVVRVSGDLAYTVGFERGDVSVLGGPKHPMVIRATQIYRRTDAGWGLVHRHGDFPPKDLRKAD